MTTKIPHIIHVDLQSHAKRQIVYMKQGDKMSRELLIFFYNGGVVWSVPSEITSVSLSYCKADKVHGCYDHIAQETAYVFNEGRTSVTMAIHPQVLTAVGNVICELKLCNASGHALNTFNFVINCEQSPHAMGQKSEGYWNNVFDGATFTPHVSQDGVISWTNDKDLPNPDPVRIDDGATFTPHVSDAGILSWTNDKGLPNPAPIDLKEFVVDPSDIPVVPMDIITSGNAVANANNDNAVLTPAAAKAIAQEYGGDSHNIKVFDLDDVSTTELYVLADEPKCAVFLAYNVANYTPDSEAETVVYPYENKLLLLPMTGCKLSPLGNYLQATFEQDVDLVTYTTETPPVAVTVRKTVRVTVQSGASAGDPDVKTVEIVPTEVDRICPEPIATTTNASYSRTVFSFDATKTYHEGDLVLYGNQFTALHRCSVAEHTGAWNASHFPKIDGDSDLFQIADGVDLRSYIPAILAGNAKMYFSIHVGKPYILLQACKASVGGESSRGYVQVIFQNTLGGTPFVFLTLAFYIDDGEVIVRKAECLP